MHFVRKADAAHVKAMRKMPRDIFPVKQKVDVVAYDPCWPDVFKQQAEKVGKALGALCQGLHHVGSTAVPHLAAKPTIDMIAEVQTLHFDSALLDAIGYRDRGGFNLPLRKSFTYRSPTLNVNLHVFERNDPEVTLNVLFRDYLRDNPKAREQYAALKHALVKKDSAHVKAGMYKGYTLGKNDFIQNILRKAGYDRLRFVLATHDKEWQAVHMLRSHYVGGAHERQTYDKRPLDHPQHKHFLLYAGVQITGYAHVQLQDDKHAMLRMMVIDQMHQNKGYDGALLALINKWLRLMGYHTIDAAVDNTVGAFGA